FKIGNRQSKDRKIHFNAIVDYAVIHNKLMGKVGIDALELSTKAGGADSTVTILGVKDCHRIRDLLAEIDVQREK
ncbi:MAG: hypothetical protein AAGA58_19405, partial [Verrucomicrobiota bacterium]